MMITQTWITIWHKAYNSATRMYNWIPTVIDKASLQSNLKTTVTDNGLKSANVISIRIPTTDNIEVANGDKVEIGASSSSLPADAYTVVGFADNRKGSRNVWHWRVMCQ